MYALQTSFSSYSYIFFVLVIVSLSWFIINLFLAVLFDEFMMANSTKQEVNKGIDEWMGAASPRGTAAGTSAAGGADETRSLLSSSALRSDGNGAAAGGFGLLGQIVRAPWFDCAAISLVLANMVIMCMPYDGMSDAYASQLDRGEVAISLLFMVEMSLKLGGLGCRSYWSDRWNALDGSIVLATASEMLLSLVASALDLNVSFLRMLRLLRVLRLLRLTKSFSGMQLIIKHFLQALPQVLNMCLVLIVAVLIISLMGMQLFGGQYGPCDGYELPPSWPTPTEPPNCDSSNSSTQPTEPLTRYNFDYFGPAIITTFVLLTGKWTEAMVR
jgi:hypothetical protein